MPPTLTRQRSRQARARRLQRAIRTVRRYLAAPAQAYSDSSECTFHGEPWQRSRRALYALLLADPDFLDFVDLLLQTALRPDADRLEGFDFRLSLFGLTFLADVNVRSARA